MEYQKKQEVIGLLRAMHLGFWEQVPFFLYPFRIPWPMQRGEHQASPTAALQSISYTPRKEQL